MMALTGDEDRAERQRWMDQMAINIEKMRSDMRWESRKFLAQFVVAFAAAIGAGVALGNYLAKHEPPPVAPAAQVIFQPGSIVVTPAPPAPVPSPPQALPK